MSPKTPKYRDVSSMLRSVRQFLLGRKHNLHVRFEPKIAPRSVPTADIVRSRVIGYSDRYYHERSPIRAVKRPIVAPIGVGPPIHKGGKPMKANKICFDCAPSPGLSWGWDGHDYYEHDSCRKKD